MFSDACEYGHELHGVRSDRKKQTKMIVRQNVAHPAGKQHDVHNGIHLASCKVFFANR